MELVYERHVDRHTERVPQAERGVLRGGGRVLGCVRGGGCTLLRQVATGAAVLLQPDLEVSG